MLICCYYLFCIKYDVICELKHFKTYSQELEDLILLCVFYDVKKGFYIDVGANDPDIISVTKAFYLKGWNGINIEPLPDKYNLLLQKRQRDINLRVGIGKNKEIRTLYLKGGMSTIYKNLIKKSSKSINIEIDTMAYICKENIKKKNKNSIL